MKVPWLWIFFLAMVALLLGSVYSMWGVAGLTAVPLGLLFLVLLGKRMGGWLLHRAFMIPFAAKGKVLRGATLDVHSVTPCEVPKRLLEFDDDAECPAKDQSWYWIDATITPKPTGGPFHLWEAGELLLVPEKTRAGMPSDDADEWNLYSLKIWDAEHQDWQKDEAYKYPGPQRLKMRVGLPPNVRRAKLRYYFEVFGEVQLPPHDRPIGETAASEASDRSD
jgi:hypothetical protein